MADKAISALTEATSVGSTDKFVLEQSGTAKHITGETLISELATAVEEEIQPNVLYLVKEAPGSDTYIFNYADGTEPTRAEVLDFISGEKKLLIYDDNRTGYPRCSYSVAYLENRMVGLTRKYRLVLVALDYPSENVNVCDMTAGVGGWYGEIETYPLFTRNDRIFYNDANTNGNIVISRGVQ